MEIRIALTAKQKAFLRAVEQYPITFYGGAKGGGKSHGLRNIMLLRRLQYPGSTGAIFRKTYGELDANHIRPIFMQFPGLKKFYNEQKKLLTLPNQSTLEFCYLDSEKDLHLYQGREFHDLGIEEAGQWTEVMFKRLLGSNRSARGDIKPRALLTGNPGGVGHGWLKRIFIDRRFNDTEDPADYHFVQALVDDNPALLENDPAYVKRLNSEPNEALRRAYRYGDWDIFAGQYFSEIRREIHMIKPFPIPKHWNRFGAYDFGFNHPAGFGWFATDEDGNVYMYREFARANMRVDQFAQAIKEFDDTAALYPIVAGWDCWAQKGVLKEQTPPTVAEEFRTHDIMLKRAVIDRIQGATQVRNYLAWQNLASGRTKPRFFIFETCPIAFDCLSRMLHDPDNLEDVLKVDATEGDPFTGDDMYDVVRYALMSRPMLSDADTERAPVGSEKWGKQEQDAMEQAILDRLERDRQQQLAADEPYL